MKLLIPFLLLTSWASADTIQFLGSLTQENNGIYYVGPYNLLDNGVPILGTCITWNLEVGPPYSWQATDYQLVDFSAPVQQELEEAEWLNLQFSTQPLAYWPYVHQAIWDIFGANYSDSFTLSWETEAQENYQAAGKFSVLIPNEEDLTQSFLVPAAATSEPGSFWIGFMALALWVGRTQDRSIIHLFTALNKHS